MSTLLCLSCTCAAAASSAHTIQVTSCGPCFGTSFCVHFLKWAVYTAAPGHPESTGTGHDNSCNNKSIWSNRSPVVQWWIYFLRGWLNENIAEEVIDEKRERDRNVPGRSGKEGRKDSEGEGRGRTKWKLACGSCRAEIKKRRECEAALK